MLDKVNELSLGLRRDEVKLSSGGSLTCEPSSHFGFDKEPLPPFPGWFWASFWVQLCVTPFEPPSNPFVGNGNGLKGVTQSWTPYPKGGKEVRGQGILGRILGWGFSTLCSTFLKWAGFLGFADQTQSIHYTLFGGLGKVPLPSLVACKGKTLSLCCAHRKGRGFKGSGWGLASCEGLGLFQYYIFVFIWFWLTLYFYLKKFVQIYGKHIKKPFVL